MLIIFLFGDLDKCDYFVVVDFTSSPSKVQVLLVCIFLSPGEFSRWNSLFAGTTTYKVAVLQQLRKLGNLSFTKYHCRAE